MTQSEGHADRQPPTPDGLPLVGNLSGLVSEPFEAFPRWQAKYGDAVRAELGGDAFYVFYHPDHVRQVLVEDDDSFDKGSLQRSLFEPLTRTPSVALSTGEEWRHQRRGLQSAFSEDKLNVYLETIDERTRTWVESKSDGETISIEDEMTTLALETLSRVFLGVTAASEDDPFRRACVATSEKYDGSLRNNLLPNWVPTPTNREFDRSTDAFDEAMRALIRRCDSTDGDDALTELVAQNARSDAPSLSEESIHNNLMGFLLAGHQTIAVAITYVWYLLATHPRALERAREEAERELGDDTPTMDDLERLDYIDAVVTEAMRYYPPVHFVLREAEVDTTVGGYTVPEGSGVLLPEFVIHRDGRWFDAPDRFDPERWLGDGPDCPEFAYFPFGGGPHLCYGRRISLAYLKTVVAIASQRARFTAETQSFSRSSSITARPDEDVLLTVERR